MMIVVLVRGKFLRFLTELMNRGLMNFEEWCRNEGLSDNPDKSIIITLFRNIEIGNIKVNLENDNRTFR